MARRSQCSNAGDNPLDPNYLPPHYREEYRLAVDSLVEEDLDGYYEFLQRADVVDFLSPPEIQYIQSSIQLPHQGNHPQHPYLDTGGDGSSDTYWPIHSDTDAPGLDLGWPEMHHFGGPAEVTTLVNPPEPDMPSIKEQARRLIKNAQQVIAIVMDMFTDVDVFADLLNAAMRNVAVYILLDEQNVHLFINMVSNCRVNLQAIQFLRVRTVSGITYHCRSGKSFKGQMMDRFILTDCRAVLSGNYSFMWSFEKLHRCMAHLFLGQLVSTFDEEFRILFAQSQPLILENLQVEDFGPLQKRPYPSKLSSMHREPKKFMSLDTAHPEDWPRHSYDERMDPMVQLKRHDTLHGPADMYGRFSPQQPRMDPHFDQGPSRLAMLENPAFKRHSYAEGGRYTFPQQQGLPDHEAQGRQFHRGQLPNALPGPEAEYGGYDKFWNQDYHPSEQFSEPALPPDLELPDNFDPVLNYLSSTRNVDFDQGMEKLQPPPDVPFGSPYARRLSAGQVYACQTSPPPSSSAEEKNLLPDPNADRKDPKVKRGLRNWRISSYLNTCDNPGDEGLPSMTPQGSDPFEAPSHPVPPVQQAAPGIDLGAPKIPNVREFKVPAVPRVSQIPGYAKTAAREHPKTQPEENPTEVKTTPTPSESSSTTDGDKTEEAEPKEPKTGIRREETFRRNYNAAVQRSSRLRSSLIFSSLEDCHQDTKTASGQEEEDSDQKDGKTTKLPFVSQVLGKRRPAREPFEWSRYIKSSTDKAAPEVSKPDDGTSKAEDEDSSKENDSKDPTETPEVKKSSEAADVQQANASPSVPRSKPSESELPKTTQPINPPKSLLASSLFVDMNDPDTRLMFFKELAAKRKAAKAAEAEKSKEKAPMKTPTDKKEEHAPKEASDKKRGLAKQPSPSPEGASVKNVITEDGGKTGATEASAIISDKKKKKKQQKSPVNNEPCVPKSCENDQTSVSTVSEIENSPSEAPLPVSSDTEAPPSLSPENPKLPEPAVKECILTATTKESSADVTPLEGAADKNKALDSTSKESSLTPNTQTSADSETSISSPAPPSDLSTAPTSSPQSTPTPTASSSVSEDATSSPVGPPEPIKPSSPILLQIIEEDPQNPTASPDTPKTSQSDSASDSISSQTTSVVDAESDVSHDKCDGASGVETSEAPSSDSQRDAPGSESSDVVQPSPKDADRDDVPPSHSPSSPRSCLPAQDAKAEQKKATTPPPVDTPPESTTDFPVSSDISSKTPESETCESSTSEPPAPADNTNVGPQMEISKDPNLPEPGEIKTDTESTSDISQSAAVCNDKINDQARQNNCSDPAEVAADEATPPSPQSKQQKPNQLRYHSSTANVLSSSNLRDDTKLLLEQISANSQSRNEAPKEAPVTDDEKEDEADKNAQREKERGIRSFSRGQPKNPEEREKLLERIQSMRKDRKVYSRFEMAP